MYEGSLVNGKELEWESDRRSSWNSSREGWSVEILIFVRSLRRGGGSGEVLLLVLLLDHLLLLLHGDMLVLLPWRRRGGIQAESAVGEELVHQGVRVL